MMNRRSFIGAVAALVGAITAKVTAGPTSPQYVAGWDAACGMDETKIVVQRISPVVFTEAHYRHLNELWGIQDPCSPEDIAARTRKG
jgi:hypothetical protein